MTFVQLYWGLGVMPETKKTANKSGTAKVQGAVASKTAKTPQKPKKSDFNQVSTLFHQSLSFFPNYFGGEYLDKNKPLFGEFNDLNENIYPQQTGKNKKCKRFSRSVPPPFACVQDASAQVAHCLFSSFIKKVYHYFLKYALTVRARR